MMVDTTDPPDLLAAKVHKRLSRELFSFTLESNPAFQGMEHLARELTETSGITTEEQAAAKRKEWNIQTRGLGNLLERTQRVAIALTANP